MDRLEEMRRARDDIHQFLVSYLHVRSRVGRSVLVLVLEGRLDIAVYDIWIARTLPPEAMEPFEVKGKKNVLRLAELLDRSVESKDDKVVFCVDHDFDGTSGLQLTHHTYMTDAYSVENFLVSAEAIDRILIRDLDVTGSEIESRAPIIAAFRQRLDEFNRHMLHLNAHIRYSRLDNGRSSGLPEGVGDFLEVTLDTVRPKLDLSDSQVCVQALRLLSSPLQRALDEHVRHLLSVDPSRFWRGKYLVDFARRFVSQVCDDRRSENPRFFRTTRKGLPDPTQNWLVCLANASPTPPSFVQFLAAQRSRWGTRALSG